jgi:hypothetical protein
VKWTELSKKEQGRQRYLRHEGRVRAQRASAVRTRPSDICPPRLTDGISGLSPVQVYIPPKVNRALQRGNALPLEFLARMFDSIKPA